MARPKKKPEYNSEEVSQQIIEAITDAYLNPSEGTADEDGKMYINLLAEEFSMSRIKVRKLLITSGAYETPISRQVNELHKGGKSVMEIQTIMTTVSSIISIVSAATVSVLFSTLSRVQNDPSRFMGIFENYQMVIGMLVIPMGVGMYLYRDLLTAIMLGEQWMNCADFIGIYSLANAAAIVTNSFFSEMYRALGKPRVSMLAQFLYLCFLVPTIYVTSTISFAALCIGTTVSVFGFMVVHFVIVKFIMKKPIAKMLYNLGLACVPSLIMAVFGIFMQKCQSDLVWQVFSIGCCVLVYFAAVLLVKPLRIGLKYSELTAGLYAKVSCLLKCWRKDKNG